MLIGLMVCFLFFCGGERGLMGWCVAQCPREGCEGAQAFFYQVQIRSADEPMTTFYKVCVLLVVMRRGGGEIMLTM